MRKVLPAEYIRQPVFLALGLVTAGSLCWLPVLRHAPNRLLSGVPLGVASLGPGALPVVAASVLLLVTGFLPKSKALACATLFVAWALTVSTVIACGLAATHLAENAPDLARTSVASGSWLLMVAGLLALSQAVSQLRPAPAGRIGIFIAVALGFAVPAASGLLGNLALLKEWQAKREVFSIALWQHAAIVLGTLVPALAAGLPLGLIAFRKQRVRDPLLSALGLIQTIPSIALFGLLMVPLTSLGDAFPLVRSLGIRGVGPAPAIVALTLYALLPVVRNTVAGLESVPADLLEAARGQGMTDFQIFVRAELPLAAPVILAGLRVTVVQTIGLAAVAALIGAGGLGSLMFQGLFADAPDLILLGAIPIVVIAVVVDLGFRLVAESGQRRPA